MYVGMRVCRYVGIYIYVGMWVCRYICGVCRYL